MIDKNVSPNLSTCDQICSFSLPIRTKPEPPSFSKFQMAGYHTKTVAPRINLFYVSKEACKSILSNFLYILIFHYLHILILQKRRGNTGILLESKKSILTKYNCSNILAYCVKNQSSSPSFPQNKNFQGALFHVILLVIQHSHLLAYLVLCSCCSFEKQH